MNNRFAPTKLCAFAISQMSTESMFDIPASHDYCAYVSRSTVYCHTVTVWPWNKCDSFSKLSHLHLRNCHTKCDSFVSQIHSNARRTDRLNSMNRRLQKAPECIVKTRNIFFRTCGRRRMFKDSYSMFVPTQLVLRHFTDDIWFTDRTRDR